MGRNLILMLREELGNLDKDPESRRAAMKALTTYIEEVDSRTVPLFLALVSETKEPDSSVAECKLYLLEVLARVHGRSIVLHIDSITSMIIETVLSSTASFALLQACSKVVPAIAHHVIDPSMPDDAKKRIISILCKPFADCLMGPQASIASGAAVCLRALVESDSWQFASDELVNEVCLKVAGALEEEQTQMNSHLGLVMALLKRNALIVEAYARSLVRSGLQILNAGVNESASQRRLSAIQMINFLMKRVDSRSILSEITNIVHVLWKCEEEDRMAYVRGAAFEALQTAKMVAARQGSGYEVSSSSPILGWKADESGNGSSSWAPKDHPIDKRGAGSPQVPSPESQIVDDFVDYDALVDWPFSVERSSCSFVCATPANRRRWSCDFGVADKTLRDGGFCKAGSGGGGGGGGPVTHFKQSRNGGGGLRERHTQSSETLSETGQSRATYMETRAIAPTPQISRLHLTADNVKADSAPQKLQRYHQNSSRPRLEDLERECSRTPMSRTLDEVRGNRAMALVGNDISQNLNSEVKRRKNHESRRKLENQQHIQDADFVTDSTNSVSSVGGDHADSAAGCKDGNGIQILRKRSIGCNAALGFFCCLCLIFLAVILSEWWIDDDDDDDFSYVVVPT